MTSLLRSRKELRQIQKNIAEKIVLNDTFNKPRIVAGIDMAFLGDLAIIACVIVDFDSLNVKANKMLITRLDFPYVSTFLSFREGPPIIEIIRSIETKAEVYLINAQGIAHPMRCGCASYVGVLANVPTIGVTSRNLCGEYDHEPEEVGRYVPMYYSGRAVGWILKSREGCRPIFISPGHLIGLKSSVDVTIKCIKNNKLPEPIQIAHTVANNEKRRISRVL